MTFASVKNKSGVFACFTPQMIPLLNNDINPIK